MKKVFINANNAKTGGGITIIEGLLQNIMLFPDIFFIVLVPSHFDKMNIKSDNLLICTLPKVFSSTLLAPFVYEFYLSNFILKHKVDGVINLGDLLINIDIPQVYVFDWPYAVYDDPIIWKNLSFKAHKLQKFKKFLIRSKINNKNIKVIAQTSAISTRLIKQYNLAEVEVMPVPVSFNQDNRPFEGDLPTGIKLLYLSYYYPHKNFEILLEVAQKVKKLSLSYKIIITINESQSASAGEFLNQIRINRLESIIINIGPIPNNLCLDLMTKADGLIMPTLLETYGIPYIEAMFAKLPIFTSKRDFSEAVCGNAAFYFDPLEADSILNCLQSGFSNEELKNEKLIQATKKVDSLPSWYQYLDGLIKPIFIKC
jgi:glycosyltransferase involved in cell wall biosynthesis